MTSLFDPARLEALFAVLGHTTGRELLQSFADAIPGEARALAALAAEGDLRATARSAHSLKGAAANFGAAELQAVSHEVEMATQLAPEAETLLPLIARLEQIARRTSSAARML